MRHERGYAEDAIPDFVDLGFHFTLPRSGLAAVTELTDRLSKGDKCRYGAGFRISAHRRIRRDRVQRGQEIRPVPCRLPPKSVKVGAASCWPQTKRLFYPLRNDPAAKRRPFQNVETAEPVARSRQLET